MSSSKVKAGEAYVEIGIRNRIAAGAKGVQADLDKLGRKITSIGSVIGAIGLSMGAPFAFAASKLASFDDAMRATGAVSRSTAAELSSMTNVAKELGRTTSFTAVEVGMLMTELGRAGFAPKQIEDMTGAVLDLARATGTDAVLASGIMAATIRQFGLAASDAARVADVLTAAANGSFNTVEQLGEALSYAGPVAADFNMSIEETTAILGTLGNVGIQASSAGTALRRLLTITGAEAERLQGIFGVSFVDSAGNARPLIDTLGEVATATNGLGTAARSAKFNEAFGLLGITGASAIGKVTTETKALHEALLGAEGQAAKTAIAMDAGLGGSFRKIASAVEGVVIAIGESFGSSLQGVTDSLTASLGGVTSWIEKNKELVSAVAATSAALVGVGAVLVTAGVASQVAAAGIGTLLSITSAASAVFAIGQAMVAAYGAATLATAAVLAAASGSASGAAIGFALLNGAYALSPAIAGAAIAAWGFLGATLAGLNAVTLATAAVFTAASGSASGTTAAVLLLNGAYALSPVVAGAVVAAWGFVGATLAALAAPTTLSASMAGLLSATWTATAGVVASAWAVIAGPLVPFIAAGAAIVGILGLLGGAAALGAVAGSDFGKAWQIVTTTFGKSMGIVKDTFGAIKEALSSGDYQTAAQALWLGLQATFWTGVQAVIDTFKWMWNEAWGITKRFFGNLIGYTWKAMKGIASAILNPFTAVESIKQTIADLAGSAMSFDVTARADGATLALKALRAQLIATREQNDADKEANRIRDEGKSAQQKRDEEKAKVDNLASAGGLTPEEATAAKAKIDAGASDSDKFAANKKQRIEDVNAAIESGEITPGDGHKQIAAIQGETEAYAEKVKAIEMEILALEKGEDAAENARLKNEGLTETEIASIQVLKDKKKALEELKDAQDKTQGKRVDGIFGKADKLGEQGISPADIFKRVMAQINSDEKAGSLNKEAASGARDRARDDMDTRIGDLNQQGKELANSLRSPFEVMQDEIKGFKTLRNANAIDDTTLQKATEKVKADFAETNGRGQGVDNAISDSKANGPTATFSAFGAGVIGMGQAKDKKELIEIAKSTREMAKAMRKERKAKFE